VSSRVQSSLPHRLNTESPPSLPPFLQSLEKRTHKIPHKSPLPLSLTSASSSIPTTPTTTLNAPGTVDGLYFHPASGTQSDILAIASRSVHFRNSETARQLHLPPVRGQQPLRATRKKKIVPTRRSHLCIDRNGVKK